MNAIIKYLSDMLPFALVFAPIYVIGRASFLCTAKKKLNLPREAAMLLFAMFALALASQTVLPKLEFTSDGSLATQGGVHTTNLIPFRVFADTYKMLERGDAHALIINFTGNIVMFMPIGFFPPLLWNVSCKKAVMIGALASLFIEVVQLFLPRSTDVDDLILNTVGAALGVGIYVLIDKRWRKITEKFK